MAVGDLNASMKLKRKAVGLIGHFTVPESAIAKLILSSNPFPTLAQLFNRNRPIFINFGPKTLFRCKGGFLSRAMITHSLIVHGAKTLTVAGLITPSYRALGPVFAVSNPIGITLTAKVAGHRRFATAIDAISKNLGLPGPGPICNRPMPRLS